MIKTGTQAILLFWDRTDACSFCFWVLSQGFTCLIFVFFFLFWGIFDGGILLDHFYFWRFLFGFILFLVVWLSLLFFAHFRAFQLFLFYFNFADFNLIFAFLFCFDPQSFVFYLFFCFLGFIIFAFKFLYQLNKCLSI